MRARKIIKGIIVGVVLLALAYKVPQTRFILDFLTPIPFYGKVVDERGTPIPNASVELSFCSNPGPGEGHTKTKCVTDSNGDFSAWGHGLGVTVGVSKDGYYRLPKSDGNFSYVEDAGATDWHAGPWARAIFVLRKRGQAEQLIHFAKAVHMWKDGSPVELDLSTGKVVALGHGDLRVETWTHDEGIQRNSNQHYDWRCRISAPGGGLIPRVGEFDFQAPLDGYSAFDEIDMPASLGSNWRERAAREYFVKLSGGRSARIEFEMVAGTPDYHLFMLNSYLNANPASRNLEYDPKTVIEALRE